MTDRVKEVFTTFLGVFIFQIHICFVIFIDHQPPAPPPKPSVHPKSIIICTCLDGLSYGKTGLAMETQRDNQNDPPAKPFETSNDSDFSEIRYINETITCITVQICAYF